jgi:molybdopterin molybdotransferase
MSDCCAQPGLLPVETALQRLLDLAGQKRRIRQLLRRCRWPETADGRVLAESLLAGLDLPPWDNSAMDGYALRLADWTRRAAGHQSAHFCRQCTLHSRIDSPAPVRASLPAHRMPAGADCVEMQENV